MSVLDDLVTELRRRAVIKVAAIYAAVSWGVLQFADIAFPRLGFPDWTITFILIIAAIGFPVALVMAWVFERTPEGVKVTQPLSEAEKQSSQPGRWGDFLIMAALSVLVGALYLERFIAPAEQQHSTAPIAPVATTAEATTNTVPSIAVLPLINLSSNAENAYFAAGMHEDVLTHLSRIEGIKVISRTSMMRYEGNHNKSVTEIAEELGVQFLLEGSVRRAGDDVRITFQLIDPAQDGHLWAENYDRKLENVFAVQSEVAQEVARQLRVEMSPETIARVDEQPTENLAAYDNYLQARELLRGFSGREESQKIQLLLTRAIELDPSFAEAYSLMAYNKLLTVGLGSEWQDIKVEVYRLAQKAVELKPEGAISNLYLGWVYLRDQKPSEAKLSLLRAEDLNPNNAEIKFALAQMSLDLGERQASIDYLEEAIQLDPLNPGTLSMLGSLLGISKPAEALTHLNKAVDINPQQGQAFAIMGNIYQSLGDFEGFYNNWRKAAEVSNFENVFPIYTMNFLMFSVGAHELADQYAVRAVEISPTHELVFAMRSYLLLADPAKSHGPEHQALIAEWLLHNPESLEGIRNLGDSAWYKARWAALNEKAPAAHQYHLAAISEYKKVISKYMTPDGYPIYNNVTWFAAIHYAINLAQTNDPRSEAILRNLADQLSASGGSISKIHLFCVLAFLGEDDAALDALELSFQTGLVSHWIVDRYINLGLERFKSNTRFNAIMLKIRQRNEKTLAYIQKREAESPSFPNKT